MYDTLLPPKLHDFVEEKMQCPTHRRMMHLGMATAKVALMYQWMPGEAIPDDAQAFVLLIMKGLESGDGAQYAEYDRAVTDLYRAWLSSREVH